MLKENKKASESNAISAAAQTPVISLGAEAKRCALRSSTRKLIFFKRCFYMLTKIDLFTWLEDTVQRKICFLVHNEGL